MAPQRLRRSGIVRGGAAEAETATDRCPDSESIGPKTMQHIINHEHKLQSPEAEQ